MSTPHTRALVYSAIVTLGGLVFGLDLGVIAGTFDYIKEQFALSDWQIGTVGAAPSYGAIFALLFAGAVCNRLGRKKSIQLIAMLYLVSAVTSALAPDYWSLVAARFLGGLAFCSLALASMYIGEIAPASMRGACVAINQFNIIVGLTAAYLINFLIGMAAGDGSTVDPAGVAASLALGDTAWRWMLGAEVPFALLWLVLVSMIPESPRWLIMMGREHEARASMARLMPEDAISSEFESIQKNLISSGSSPRLLEQIKTLLSPRARGAVIIGLIVAVVQPITGINAIYTYAPLIFTQTGAENQLLQTLVLGVVGLVASVVAFLLVDRLGRRVVLIVGLLGCVVCLGLCGWGFHLARYTLDEQAVAAIEKKLEEDLRAEVRLLDSGVTESYKQEPGDELAAEVSTPLQQEVAAAEQRLRNSLRQRITKVRDEIGVEYQSDIAFVTRMRELLGEESVEANKDMLIGNAVRVNASLILFAVLGFIASFQFSIGPVMWVVLSEIFGTQLRGIAIPAAQLTCAVISTAVQQFFPWQLANMGARDIFLFYCVCVTVGLVALAALLPETKNKSIEQIEAELRGSA